MTEEKIEKTLEYLQDMMLTDRISEDDYMELNKLIRELL